MDFLKAEIASKKRSLSSSALSPSPSADAPPPPKYLKRSELDRIRQEEQEREARDKEEQRKRKLYGTQSTSSSSTKSASPAPPPRASTSTSASTRTTKSPAPGTPSTSTPEPSSSSAAVPPPPTSFNPEERFLVSNDEAIRRLRLKGAPIRLFGESDKDRRLRLRALELLEAEQEGASGERGQRNEFQRAVEEQERREALKREAAGRAVKDKNKDGKEGKEKAKEGTPATDGEAEKSADEDAAIAASAVSALPATLAAGGKKETEWKEGKKDPNPKEEEVIVDLALVKTNPHKVYPQVYHAFKRVLKEWELSLDARPDAIKRSAQGKMAAATHATSAEYLKPLFKSLRKRDLPPDVLPNLAEIAHFMQTREYLRASDAYLRLSIGNAPWPIGVTMVGIHERSGREKIHSNNVAHVLNDETSRKYIQSLKRLLTFAQAVRPPDDVSQKMG
ncbi:hypothetical protein JCM8547_000036 [Rhodosporidiobolus lusitaniae]